MHTPVEGRERLPQVIDLRSDTSTLPTSEMREAMSRAELGNDGYAEDPIVNKLEDFAASLLGKEKALFVPSGTMGNLLALMSFADRGEAIVAEERSHIIANESGPEKIAGLHAVGVKSDYGAISPGALKDAISKNHAKLVTIENSHNNWGGTVVPLENMQMLRDISQSMQVPLHLDGARIFNAATYLGVEAKRIASCADSVMFCLSKGLCAPVGSLVAGSADFIAKTRLIRKMLGGGMRQAGVLAAAGLVALNTMPARLRDDHLNARRLAGGLSELGFRIDMQRVQTNIVLFSPLDVGISVRAMVADLARQGIKLDGRSESTIRCVTHKDISKDDIEYTLGAIKSILRNNLNVTSSFP
jgi:threonine aldolase